MTYEAKLQSLLLSGHGTAVESRSTNDDKAAVDMMDLGALGRDIAAIDAEMNAVDTDLKKFGEINASLIAREIA